MAASVTNAKGLLNAPGENNCFLNSAVQVSLSIDDRCLVSPQERYTYSQI